MNPCSELIETIYNHPAINRMIGKIKPDDLQADLKQEMAMALLNSDCNKLLRISNEENIIGYSLRIIWNLGTLQNGIFYKNFKKRMTFNDMENYIESLQQRTELKGADIATKILNDKMVIDAENAHESMIFQKYVELKSTKKVAEYFGIPFMHTYEVIRKTKKELRTQIRKRM